MLAVWEKVMAVPVVAHSRVALQAAGAGVAEHQPEHEKPCQVGVRQHVIRKLPTRSYLVPARDCRSVGARRSDKRKQKRKRKLKLKRKRKRFDSVGA